MDAKDVLETLPSWIGLGAGGGASFFTIKWFVEWLGGRVDKREAAAVANSERLDTKTYKLIETLEQRVNTLTARLDQVEEELHESREAHAACQGELAKLRATVQGLGDARQTAALLVAADRQIDRTVAALTEKIKEDKHE